MQSPTDRLDPTFSLDAIVTPEQFRDALSRLRGLEIEGEDSPRSRERAALEIGICRYLANCELRVRN